MFEEQIPVRLISGSSQSLNINLYETLDRLGYKEIETFQSDNIIDRKISIFHQIFIFPLTNDTHVKNKSRLSDHIKDHPVLGIITVPDLNMKDEYMELCNDFIYWPCSDNEFAYRMKRLGGLFRHNRHLSCDDDASDDFISMNMIGKSQRFLNVLKKIRKVSRYDAPVLIEGETGTGKELAARAIHYLSSRNEFPFIPVNCGAIPDNLVENELFGHEKGAYTDAKNFQKGIVSLAKNGTIFLDEVEAFSQKGQVVLLRFLQDQLYKPLGADRCYQANVRVIAASNKKLSHMVERGLFRQDLFYRLEIIKIEMPLLSQRGNDIDLLADYFLNKFRFQYNQPDKFLHPDTIKCLRRYGWPGNVRELENLLHREFLLADNACIILEKESTIRKERRKSNIDRRQEHFFKYNFKEAKAEIVRKFEIEYVTRLLYETNGNVTMAAQRAGKERRSLGKLLKKHDINKTLINRS